MPASCDKSTSHQTNQPRRVYPPAEARIICSVLLRQKAAEVKLICVALHEKCSARLPQEIVDEDREERDGDHDAGHGPGRRHRRRELHVVDPGQVRAVGERRQGLARGKVGVSLRDDGDVDAAILIGQPGETRLHYDHLFDCYLSPVCSPAYLERHGAITLPGDLSTHMLLQVYPSARDWQVWLDANQADGANPEEGLQLESYDVALSSAAQGMGVALGQQPYISEALRSGELVELFPERRVKNPNRWYLAYRADRRLRQKVAPLREWLLGEVSADDALASAAGP